MKKCPPLKTNPEAMWNRFSEANIYYTDYEGYADIIWHDRDDNALKRWFDNYKLDPRAMFASHYEWLVVEDVTATAKNIKKRYVCSIGDDRTDRRREIAMDHTAPPPPMVFFAAKIKYEPPPPKSERELALEREYRRMQERSMRSSVYDFNPNFNSYFERLDAEINHRLSSWVLPLVPKSMVLDFSSKPDTTAVFTPPPAPKHRRNK